MDNNLIWTKSSASKANGQCVEIASLPDGGVALRNSQNPTVVLSYTRGEWDAFMDAVHKGEFDHFGRTD